MKKTSTFAVLTASLIFASCSSWSTSKKRLPASNQVITSPVYIKGHDENKNVSQKLISINSESQCSIQIGEKYSKTIKKGFEIKTIEEELSDLIGLDLYNSLNDSNKRRFFDISHVPRFYSIGFKIKDNPSDVGFLSHPELCAKISHYFYSQYVQPIESRAATIFWKVLPQVGGSVTSKKDCADLSCVKEKNNIAIEAKTEKKGKGWFQQGIIRGAKAFDFKK